MSNYSDSHFDSASSNTSWYKVFHLIKDGSKVLDVGCSSGNFGVELINRKNCVVDGLELSTSDAEVASKKLRRVHQLNVETDDLSDLDSDYDVIYFGDVIEHLLDPSNALIRIQKHLKSDGVVLFSIPNMAHISIRLLLLAGDFSYAETGLLDKTHLHFYTLDEIKRVFNDANMVIDTLDYVKKDFPQVVIEKELEKYGLRANNKFYKKMAGVEASAFQFVGTAKKSTIKLKKSKLDVFSPVIDMFDEYHTNVTNDYKNSIKSLEDENARLNKQLGDLNGKLHLRIARKIKNKLNSSN